MVQKVDHETLESRINVGYKSDTPLFVYGPPGIGKSDTVASVARDIAERKGKRFVKWSEVDQSSYVDDSEIRSNNALISDFDDSERPENESDISMNDLYNNPNKYFLLVDQRLAQNDPTDIKGIPDTKGSVTSWNPPDWIAFASQKNASGIVFCDELTHAPQLVQKAYFSLILDKKVDNTKISDDVYIMAAGNREEDKAGVISMPSALRNRFGHVELTPPNGGRDGDWTEWAMNNQIHESVVGFLSSRSGQSHLFKFSESNRDDKAFPTPRSWEMASDAIKSSDAKTHDEISEIAEVFVGEATASYFNGYLKDREKIEVTQYLDNPDKVLDMENKGMDIDGKHALVMGIATEYKENPSRLPDILDVVNNLDAEFGAYLLSLLSTYNEKHWDENASSLIQEKNVSEKYYKYLTGI